jgi:endogenous inhibitor of DNA gyrase (YacG/DUF329 family)
MTRKKIKCDVCGERNVKILNRHHIIPQCDERCTNKDYNIAILCPNCHANVHEGEVIIIGLYQSTDGWKLMWFKKGEEPPIEKDFWLIKQNPLILRRKDNGDK